MRNKGLIISVVKKILVSALFLAIIIIVLLWLAVNYLFIPKVAIPKLQEYLTASANDPVKLSIKDISFHPLRGFLLHNVELSGPVALEENYVLRSKQVDIDIAILPLLWKKIIVKRFLIRGVSLHIGRDTSGIWNFQPVLESDIIKNIRFGEYDFIMNNFKIKKGDIYYADYFKKGNILKRHLTNIDLSIVLEGQIYKLVISGGAKDKREEDFMLGLRYDRRHKAFDGTAKLNTSHLNEYWDYYLDHIFNPWHLKVGEVKACLEFSYLDGKLTMKNHYTIDGGALIYGDLIIKGDASATQDLEYSKADAAETAESTVTTKISLKKASLLLGSNILLDKGDCQALISNKEIIIENLSGETRGLPVSLSGNFSYLEPRQLYLKGNLGESDDTLFVKLLTDNKCALDWESKKKESHLKLHADISDLNNLVFKITAQGDMRFCDMNRLIAGAETVKGSMKVKAEVKGEADKWESLDGKAVIEVNDFSFLETKAVSFEFDLDVKKGLFIGKIPRTRFCGGTFDGEVKATMHKLGVELDIDRIDIGEFMQPASRFKGTKGIISGNIVFITHWTDPTDAVGGGYINAADCDFRSLPLFLSAREGMGSATKNADFKMPVFKKIEGNYQIKDRGLDLEGISCDAAGLNLIISGGCKFAGDVDFTIDARFLGTGMFRTARQVILPETIALDLVADSIVVEVRGRWSELKQDTTIKPIRSIFTLLPTEGSASPGKYTLEKF